MPLPSATFRPVLLAPALSAPLPEKNAMKSFFSLPVCHGDIAMALSIEDGLPDRVDVGDYDGPRGLAEVMKYSTKAREIQELADIARLLKVSAVDVIRSTPQGGGTWLYSSDEYKCLAEAGRWIISICPSVGAGFSREHGLVQRFLWLAVQIRQDREEPFGIITAIKYYTRLINIPEFRPAYLRPTRDAFQQRPYMWGFYAPASTRQVLRLASLVAADCPDERLFLTYVSTTIGWFDRYFDRNELATFSQALMDFVRADPLAELDGIEFKLDVKLGGATPSPASGDRRTR
jgi:hypothetical protein